ncbi:fatty acid-binding protein [Spodoptera frugiperda]|uniref:Fatty acid-binding protein n=1 Tax=Spodoptera frugiperda TaxID=7108 RepID=A0A9R0D0G3_SPOFR|nr:fatty acid-binding protein [Spodoptera frugiperda]XP_035435937.1 fatty acid-binding protein [Spodoptera frugiperda]
MIAGKYQHYKNEDIDDYFSAVGVPYMGRKMMAMSSPLMEISVDGDQMAIKNISLMRTVENKFKLGEEYIENMPNAKIRSVTTKLDDKKIETKSVVEDTGAACGRLYEFTDDECVITLTHEKANTPAKRYFRRVK